MNMNYKKNIPSSKHKYDFDSSDDDDASDSYQNALMSSLVALSNKNISTSDNDNDKKPTESRIDFVKNLLDGNNLRPMVDFDNFDTETATNTRLNKKIMDVRELFTSMNVKLRYIKSGTTGHTFKAISKIDPTIAFAVKVVAYPRGDDYGAMSNLSRPENAELRMLKLLSYFVVKKHTPHFVLPVGTFNTSITNFINVPANIIDLTNEKNEMYKKFIDRYHDGEFEDFVSVLIVEWCNGGDLLDYIRKNYTMMTLRHWKVIIFQILFTLAKVHITYPNFRHNDMKANNVLVQVSDIKMDRPNLQYRYEIGDTEFYIPNINLVVKIWDFDFACIDGIISNNKVNADWTNRINITKNENKYYDMHYFFNTLISKRFFPQFYDEVNGAPPEIIDFVHRVVPEKFRNGSKYINKKGRILVDTEFTTPYKVITTDPLFEKYRFHQKN